MLVPDNDEWRAMKRDKAVRTARRQFAARDYEAVIVTLRKAMKLVEPGDVGEESLYIRTVLAVANLRLRRTEEGVALLEQLLADAPDHHYAMYKLAIAYGRLRRRDEALAMIERAIELEPGSADYYWQLGTERFRMGDAAGADAAWHRGLAINPGHGPTRQSLGLADTDGPAPDDPPGA